ncbi:MAG TPA: GDP-mannose 4,6-dehydratase [Acidimicrobiia bacterium]|nr:GDP-mannose 4,6-dehydratase [Acidimicrobiia bacterium]
MRTLLVTGGAGFIGSHLAEAAVAAGDRVVAVDDLSTGSYRNVAGLAGNDAFELVVASVDDDSTLETLVREADVVYHLAAAVGVKLIVDDPVHTIETNIRGTEVVLRLANKWRRPAVVASTSEVYGKSEKVPYAEEHDMVLGPTTHSRWAYAASKAIDEFLAIAYHRRDGLPVVIARLFNTVGPRQTGRYGMVIPTFVRQAMRAEPITVYGDGTQSRAFTYVGDAVRALLDLSTRSEAYGEVFNVGGGREITIMGLAELVRDRTGSESEIVTIPYDEAYAPGFEDMHRRVPDISKLSRVTGYQPEVGLEEIIDRVADYYRQHPEFV